MSSSEQERQREYEEKLEIFKRAGPRPARANGAAIIAPEPEPPVADPWPEPLGLAAFPTGSIAGEFVSTLMPHTEADPAALLFQFLTAFGNVIGAGPHYLVEGDKHYARLNSVLVGITAKGRKGTSLGRVRALYRMVDEFWARECVGSGLSTGEGLIYQVRDERKDKDGEVVEDAAKDKRFLAISSEFASVLKVMARTGNTLSPIIRDAWDLDKLQTMTRTNKLYATGGHISQIGHVTADELRRYLDATEAANGFANRFLFVCVKRARLLPDGGGSIDWTPMAERLKRIVARAAAMGRLHMDEAARELWHARYPDLSEAHPGMLGAVIARAEAQVIRLALIYALLDEGECIGLRHLEAGLECWRYAEASARYVFGDALGDPVADGILEALRQAPDGLTRTEVAEVFSRNIPAKRLSDGLKTLQQIGLAHPEERRTGGRPATVWHAGRA